MHLRRCIQPYLYVLIYVWEQSMRSSSSNRRALNNSFIPQKALFACVASLNMICSSFSRPAYFFVTHIWTRWAREEKRRARGGQRETERERRREAEIQILKPMNTKWKSLRNSKISNFCIRKSPRRMEPNGPWKFHWKTYSHGRAHTQSECGKTQFTPQIPAPTSAASIHSIHYTHADTSPHKHTYKHNAAQFD